MATEKVVLVDIYPQLQDLHGVYALSSVLKQAGARTSYLADRNRERLLRTVVASDPDLVCYSTMSGEMSEYVAFDRRLKERWKGVSLIGGAGPTYSADILRGTTIQAYCVGEGEHAILDFVRSGFTPAKNIVACGGRDAGPYHRLADLDAMPFPDRDIVYREDSLRRDMTSKQFFSGRGCPYRCTYCFNHAFAEKFGTCGPPVRKKSVGYLLEEIEGVRRRYPLRVVSFNEDTFILDRAWFFAFAEAYPRRIGLPYTCNIRANLVDEELVRALKESGCVGVNWSIESGDEGIRNDVLKRAMSEEQIVRTGDLLAKYRIPHRVGNVIGVPGESFEQMLATVRLNSRVRPVLALGSIFAPYPGLRLTDTAVRMGLYTPAPGAWPQNYLRCDLELPAAQRRRIERLTCLFPLLVRRPRLLESRTWMRLLFALPTPALRLFWVYLYSTALARLYRVGGSPVQKARFAWRAFLNFMRT
ncbi:MAG TPA: radical SAM protein [bacterium]